MGSGKTSVMNAICNFIPREATIVTIEDTPELRLSHPYWIQHKTRESLTMEGKGSISMFDLVKHALRESADYMIVGEVRGEEGRVWAQAISTGHGGITTFHAESPEAMIARLTIPPISVEKGLLTALRTIVTTGRFIKKVEVDGKIESQPIRRVTAIYDYHYDTIRDEDIIKQIFKYNPVEDNYQLVADLTETPTAKLIIEEKGITPDEFLEDYNMRVKLFKRLKEHVDNALEKGVSTELLEYDKVTELLWLFRENPEKAIEYIDSLDSKIKGSSKPETINASEPSKPSVKESNKRKIRFIGIEEDKGD
jgi:flagellar protein FlaI